MYSGCQIRQRQDKLINKTVNAEHDSWVQRDADDGQPVCNSQPSTTVRHKLSQQTEWKLNGKELNWTESDAEFSSAQFNDRHVH